MSKIDEQWKTFIDRVGLPEGVEEGAAAGIYLAALAQTVSYLVRVLSTQGSNCALIALMQLNEEIAAAQKKLESENNENNQ